MKIAKIHLVYFSATGNTQKALREFAAGVGLPVEETDLTGPEQVDSLTLASDELAVFGVPSFGGRVPRLAAGRIAKIHGDHTPAVVITTFGNRDYDDTLLELHNIVVGSGFCVAGAAAVVAEHSIMRQFATGRPNAADCEEIRRFARAVMEKLDGVESPENLLQLAIPGNPHYKENKPIPMQPKAGKNCTKCGICADKCPARAISKECPNQTEESRCISCMRCVAVCPHQARRVGALKLAAVVKILEKRCKEPKVNTFLY